MEIISVNKEAPRGIKEMLEKYGYIDRAFLVHTDITTIYIVLNKPSKKEIKKFQNSLKVGIKIFSDLDFFILNLSEGLGFEVPIIAQNKTEDYNPSTFGNACNVILVDANQNTQKFIIRGLRMLGLSPQLHEQIKMGLEKNNYSFDLYPTAQKYLDQYSPQDFWNLAEIKQTFKR